MTAKQNELLFLIKKVMAFWFFEINPSDIFFKYILKEDELSTEFWKISATQDVTFHFLYLKRTV